MGGADYFLAGSWNFRCDECWRKCKASEGRLRWDNCWVCPICFEIRNPQDYARGIPDNQSPPWTRPTPPVYITSNTATQVSGNSLLLDSYMLGSSMLG